MTNQIEIPVESCFTGYNVRMVVVFGRPGAGKTTIADAAYEMLQNRRVQGHDPTISMKLDLDVTVPQWMKDNFSKGIYPTLKERQQFAEGCCEYVRDEIMKRGLLFAKENAQKDVEFKVLISFSFVNDDLRDIYRSAFPKASWILIDTSEEEANQRIKFRSNHFYRGKNVLNVGEEGNIVHDAGTKTVSDETQSRKKSEYKENSDWDFDPVTYPHLVLNGMDAIEKNAIRVLEELCKR